MKRNVIAFYIGVFLGIGVLLPFIAFRVIKHKVADVVDKSDAVAEEVMRVKGEVAKWREQRKANKLRK